MPEKPGLEDAAAAFAAEDESMIETDEVDLEPLHICVGEIALLVAEMPVERSPFVLVHYAVEGKRQRWGHRLDLDKRVFLDTFEDGSLSEVKEAAGMVTDFLIPHRRDLH